MTIVPMEVFFVFLFNYIILAEPHTQCVVLVEKMVLK